MTAKQRRTQAERRAATTARLVEGTIGALSEVGYTRTTAREICARAGVSAGALFGRFATLTDLVLAAAQEVAHRQIATFTQHVAQLPDSGQPSSVLPRLRASARDPINAVWVELLVAARTDPELRERFRPVVAEYAAAMLAASEQLPVLRRLPDHLRPLLVAHVVHYFDGEALSGVLYPNAAFDDQRMSMLTSLLGFFLEAQVDPAR
jgi:AcrR family transcriptional regulator